MTANDETEEDIRCIILPLSESIFWLGASVGKAFCLDRVWLWMDTGISWVHCRMALALRTG